MKPLRKDKFITSLIMLKLKQLIFCIIISSLASSLVTFCIFFVRLEPLEFSNDSYIGVITTLIGICTTFIVGWQIFSSLEVKEYIKKNMLLFSNLKDRLKETRTITKELKSKVARSEEITQELKEKLEQVNKTIENQEEISVARLKHAKAYALSPTQLLSTFFLFSQAIDVYIKLNKVGEFLLTKDDINICVNQMEITLSDLKSLTNQELKKKLINKFELDNLSFVNPTVEEYIKSWQAGRFNELYPSRIGLLLELNTKRKEILEEVIEINRQILAEDANQ